MARPKVPKTVKIIVYLTVIIFVSLVLLEISMVVLEPYLFKGFYQYDPDLGFRARPHVNGLNQFGFNDRDYPLEKDPNIYRILFVGDSFSWAGGLQGNYTALLEKKLEEYYGTHKVDVINAGYPMTHTGEQLEMLKKYGLQYNPDLVVLGFFVGNDFNEADPNKKTIVVNDVYFDIDKRKEVSILGYPIVPRSRSLHFVKQKFVVIKEAFKKRSEVKANSVLAKNKERGTFSEDTFLNIEGRRLEFFNLEKHQANIFEPRINYIFQSIIEMKKLLESRNVRFLVCIYPDEFQINEDLLNQIFEKFDLKRDSYDIELGQKLLSRFLDSNQIPFIDFLQEFRVKGKKEQLYLLRNTHWNKRGNELAAEILFQPLLEAVE